MSTESIIKAGERTHTPGPWTTEGIVPENKMGREVFIIPENNSEDWIAKMAGHGSSEADARLIAAAPDLLEALKHWQHIWEETDVEHDDCTSASDSAKAAIAKAEGSDL